MSIYAKKDDAAFYGTNECLSIDGGLWQIYKSNFFFILGSGIIRAGDA
jgi:hypothetical protein